jgi:hypothetical protein
MKERVKSYNEFWDAVEREQGELIRARFEPGFDEMTCSRCEYWMDCPWAWDAYNTDGSCLARK